MDAGWRVNVYYLDLPDDIANARILEREATGEYQRSMMTNLKWLQTLRTKAWNAYQRCPGALRIDATDWDICRQILSADPIIRRFHNG